MAVTTTQTNKPFNPRGNDQSPLAFNRAKLFSGKALDFDGVNDKVTGTASILPTGANAFSTCFYVNKDADTNGEMVFWGTRSVNQANGVMLTTGKKVLHTFFGSDLTGNVDIEISKWYFVAVTFDGTTRSIYVNGQLDASDTPSNVNVTGTSYQLGYGGAYYHNGELANAKVFNTALTAAQVADLYNTPEKVVPTGVDNTALKLWLPMQEGAGTTAYDGSGNGNHGTISGATYTHGIGAPVSQTAVIDWNKGQNLYAYSEQFDESSYWSYTQIHAVDSTDNEAPDGSLTADKIIANTNTAFHHIGKGVTGITNGVSYRFSVWAKSAGHDYILINTAGGSASGNAGPIVNLTDGSIAGSLNGEDYDATITDAGNGWYKVEYDFTSSGTTINIDYNQLPSASVAAYAGDNTKGVFLWGASLRPASSGSTYVRTGATAQTTPVLLPAGLTTGRDITGVNLFENVRKQGALNLDGNSWAEVHDNASLDMTTTATMEVWINADELDNTSQHIFVKSSQSSWTNNYGRYVLRAGENNVNWWFDDYASNSKVYAISLSGWNHLAVTKDGTAEKLYINGALVDTKTGAATFTASTFPLLIGSRTAYEEFFKNQIAQPRIYNRALTAAEVQKNYNAGKNTYTN